jgi:hypothetical protein
LQNICITTAFPTTTTSGNNAKTLHTQNKTKHHAELPSHKQEKNRKKKHTHTHTQSEEEEENNNDNKNRKKKHSNTIHDKPASERASEHDESLERNTDPEQSRMSKLLIKKVS